VFITHHSALQLHISSQQKYLFNENKRFAEQDRHALNINYYGKGSIAGFSKVASNYFFACNQVNISIKRMSTNLIVFC